MQKATLLIKIMYTVNLPHTQYYTVVNVAIANEMHLVT